MSRVKELFEKALERRSSILEGECRTNAVRLFDGIGDGLADTFLETFADRWVISTRDDRLSRDVREYLNEVGEAGRSIYWKRLDQHQKEDPQHLAGPLQDTAFTAIESGVNYEISFQSGYSQGIFLDQRENRRQVQELATSGQTVLNTFAYTGAFSVCAALGGATTTTMDLSQPYLEWAKRNMALNHLDPSEHYFCKGDTFHWLKRFAKQGRKFDGIILDPPTFSRDDKGKVFRVESHYDQLVQLASSCLTSGGWILASTNCRKLSNENYLRLLKSGLSRPAKLETKSMPEEYTGEPYLKSVWIYC